MPRCRAARGLPHCKALAPPPLQPRHFEPWRRVRMLLHRVGARRAGARVQARQAGGHAGARRRPASPVGPSQVPRHRRRPAGGGVMAALRGHAGPGRVRRRLTGGRSWAGAFWRQGRPCGVAGGARGRRAAGPGAVRRRGARGFGSLAGGGDTWEGEARVVGRAQLSLAHDWCWLGPARAAPCLSVPLPLQSLSGARLRRQAEGHDGGWR
jgi:hypothetical protein